MPVWNGLTDADHPTQILADLLTIEEQLRRLNKVKVVFTYMEDVRNNMCYALDDGLQPRWACTLCACGPEGAGPAQEMVDTGHAIAAENGGTDRRSQTT